MVTATDFGEEWIVTRNIDGATIIVALYDDATDSLGEQSDESDITTEPDGTDYARQTDTISTIQLTGTGGGDFGFENDTEITFNVSDATTEVDSGAIIVEFQSTITSDSQAQPHLIGFDTLDVGRLNLSDETEVTYEAGNITQVISAGSVV